MTGNIQPRMQEARIPPHAYRTTLSTLGQAVLRSVIDDRAYSSQGSLKSFSLVQSRIDAQHFSVVVARFAAELLLKGQTVFYVRAAAIERELQAYSYDPTNAVLSPVLSKLGKGFLVIPDVCSGLMEASWPAPGLCDFLIEHASLGGGLVLGRQLPNEWQGSPAPADASLYRDLTPDFEAMVATFTRVDIRAHDSLRTP